MKAKFLKCSHCGNIVSMIEDKGVPVKCCGENMEELQANTTDAAAEKHVPVAKAEGHKVFVEVGSNMHPMTDEHLIEWIYLETEGGGQMKKLTSADEPKTIFCLADDRAKAVYGYCNLHGLWKQDL